MLFKANKTYLAFTLFLFCVIQCEIAVCYRTEAEITPSPIEEPTTKKSGFFSGFKSFFRGSPTTTVAPIVEVTTPKSVVAPPAPKQDVATPQTPATAGQKPPPLVIPHAPLMPLGPRPETPPTSPLAGSPQQQPQWPQTAGAASTTTARSPLQQPFPQQPQQPPQPAHPQQPQFGAANPVVVNQRPGVQPNLPPGFTPYQPARPQPSGLDLSYGGATGGRPQSAGHGSFGLAPLTSSTTTTTTTTPKPAQAPLNFDLRAGGGSASPSLPNAAQTSTTARPQQQKEDFPALPAPRRPSIGTKEDYPALPTPKSPVPSTPSSPTAWNGAAIPGSPATPVRPGSPTPATPASAPTPTPNRVAFVPHAPGSTTTVRPGFESAGNSVATDAEIRALTETLYTKETNSQLNFIRVNPQGKTRSIDSADEAPQPLLEVDPKALEAPTIVKMRLLFNNYEQETMTNEHVTPNERLEENDFVDAVMATPVMRQAMQFLQNKGIVSPDSKTHRDLVKELWFTQYSRGSGKIGSSGFEHVFVNEVKNGTIIGLHNWVYFNEEEKAGRLDYKGYLKQLDLGTKGKVVKMRFTHNGLNKPVNALFIGTSPELELALYTVCFKLRPDRTCPVSLGNSPFGIVTYSWRYRGKSLIGSAFPEI